MFFLHFRTRVCVHARVCARVGVSWLVRARECIMVSARALVCARMCARVSISWFSVRASVRA